MPIKRRATPVEKPPVGYARNFAALAVEGTLFKLGAVLIGTTTVIPALVSALDGSASMVGLITGVASGAWLLPQVFVANRVARLDRRKPLMMWAAWLCRPLFFVLAALVMLLANGHPTLLLWCVAIILALFYGLDAVVSLPWMDLLSVAIPPRRRGRLQGTSQVLGGLGGVAMGGVVTFLLSEQGRWGFPANFAVILTLASFTFMLSAIALSLVQEPDGCYPKATKPRLADTLRSIPRLLDQDRAFLRLILSRIALGFAGMASSFYVLQAVQRGDLAIGQAGLLASAEVAGSVASGLLMSVIQDALGPRVHLLMCCILTGLPPIAALLFSATAGQLAIPLTAYVALFFVLGIAQSTRGWPFFNWIIEHATADHRPIYIGTINTLSALTMLAPVVAGLLVDNISYEAVFVAAAAAAIIALLLGLSLPSTRQAATEASPRVAVE